MCSQLKRDCLANQIQKEGKKQPPSLWPVRGPSVLWSREGPAQVRAVHACGREEVNAFLGRGLPAAVKPQVNTGLCVGVRIF